MIPVNDTLFLETFEDFQKVLVPLINRDRKEDGMKPLDEDEMINEFLALRKQYGINDQPGKGT